MYSRRMYCLRLWIKIAVLILIKGSLNNYMAPILAQSIGYQPNMNMGFNPYMSPVHGYGLGLPFGSYGYSSMRYPQFASFQGNANTWLGKLHANTFLKKSYPFGSYPYYGSFKNKLTLFKHPEYAFTPYGFDYGYGKHYGAAMLANNPYKSPYRDYYNDVPAMTKHSPVQSPGKHFHNQDNYAQASEQILDTSMPKSYGIIKPLVKAGVLLTTAALLGKKTLESPLKLNPSGMILSARPDN